MLRLYIRSLVAVSLLLAGGRVQGASQASLASVREGRTIPSPKLQATRQSPTDLEVGGELAGLPPGATRYITHNDLLALPQITYTVTDDSNFNGSTRISGVPLEELSRSLGAAPQSDMVVAICDDKYRANYPRDYIAAHHPLLVLMINGQPPSNWPKSSGDQGSDLGPYVISHQRFTPSFKIFSHADEPQIPWGVVRIELRDEKAVFEGIRPRGPQADTHLVKSGYRIAQQNCFRCHNMGREGGQKSGTPWLVLAAWASTSPEYFAAYVRDPQNRNPHAQMPGSPGYDDRTIGAIAAYFRTFVPPQAERKTSTLPKEGKP